MEWLVILGTVLAVSVLGLVYLTGCVGRFGFVRRLSGENKWRKRAISFGIVAVTFAILAVSLSVVNAVVIFLHEVLFFLLFGIVLRIAKRCTGKEIRNNWQGILAVSFSVIYLAVGYGLAHHVWQKNYELRTEKTLGTLKIALISDSHIGATFDGEGFAEHLRHIEAQSPDMLMIAGDYVDDWSSRDDMFLACEALGRTNFPYGVWYVYGNHDKGYYGRRDFTSRELEEALRQNGVHVLDDTYETVGDRLIVAGRRDVSYGLRKSIDELLSEADTGKYIIVLDHQPNDYNNEAGSPADLVLSGHTHGGQLIPITYVGKWFGLLDRVYGHENRQGTDFIVTSGISDWEILFKTGTRSEYVIITVEGN